MVHGDALITEKLPETSSEALLSEVQGSLDQLSAFSPSRKASCKGLAAAKQAAQSSSAPSAREATALSDAPPDRLLQSAVRHRRQTASHPQRSMACSMEPSADNTTTSNSVEAQSQLFQSPNLPGMQQAELMEARSMSTDTLIQVWAGMQPELLSHVMQQVQWTSREAVALTGVCRCCIPDCHALRIHTLLPDPYICSAAVKVSTLHHAAQTGCPYTHWQLADHWHISCLLHGQLANVWYISCLLHGPCFATSMMSH